MNFNKLYARAKEKADQMLSEKKGMFKVKSGLIDGLIADQMLSEKKGMFKVRSGLIEGLIIGVIMVAILFQVAAQMFTPLRDALNNLAATGMPLASLFTGGSGSIVLMLFSAALIIVAVTVFFGKKHK